MSRASWLELSALDARVLRATDARYERSPEKVGELARCAPDVALSTLRRLRVRRACRGRRGAAAAVAAHASTGRGAGARAMSEAVRQAIGARPAVRTGELAPAVRAPARRPWCVSGEIRRVRQPHYAALASGMAGLAGRIGCEWTVERGCAAALPGVRVDRRLAARHN